MEIDFPGASTSPWCVYRDPAKTALGSTARTPDVAAPGFIDSRAVAVVENWFYRVKGLSPCSLTPGP